MVGRSNYKVPSRRLMSSKRFRESSLVRLSSAVDESGLRKGSRMREKTIALVLGTKLTSGGGFVYERALVRLLRKVGPTLGVCVRVFSFSSNLTLVEHFSGEESVVASERPLGRLERYLLFKTKGLPAPDQYFVDEGISLVYFASPNRLAKHLMQTPFIFTVWDLYHRTLPEFPEFRGREWEIRENLYSSVIPRAFHTFVDSESTKQLLGSFYGALESRVTPIGLLFESSTGRRAKSSEALPASPYFIYPAKMWPHKNHAVLLAAMANVIDQYPEAKLVFTGAPGGEAEQAINDKIAELGIRESVDRLGFVDDDFLDVLIENAVALLMPSFGVPTNIPPLQALAFGTPVIASEGHSFEARVQSQLRLVPPTTPAGWALEMRETLASQRRLSPLIFDNQTSMASIAHVVEEFFERHASWV